MNSVGPGSSQNENGWARRLNGTKKQIRHQGAFLRPSKASKDRKASSKCQTSIASRRSSCRGSLFLAKKPSTLYRTCAKTRKIPEKKKQRRKHRLDQDQFKLLS
eukprot:6203655-Pleurochrysis_carterae.AAC.3